jgi:hypothetical protein
MIALCTAGYVWLWLGMQADGFSLAGRGSSPVPDLFAPGESHHPSHPSGVRQELPGVCLFKHATTLPCPSCGSTRSVLHILHGDPGRALYWNPLGFILLIGLIIAPVWIAHDLLRRKNSLHISFRRMEIWLKKWWIALPAVILVLSNWIWNVVKGF